jgi:threonine/homoserine/homoserine lactone efflux protein
MKSNFLAGMIVSFGGAFPPGMVDSLVLLFSVNAGYRTALGFAAGCALVEMIYVRLLLGVLHKAAARLQKTRIPGWIGVAALLVLAAYVLLGEPDRAVPQVTPGISPFVLGISVMAFNPLPFPFWLSWTMLLIHKKIVTPGKGSFWLYVFGIGCGSMLASVVYSFTGRSILEFFELDRSKFRFVLGVILVGAAAFQIWRLKRKPALEKSPP